MLVAVSAVAYVPLAVMFTPWGWSNSGILSVQWCRPLLYGVYFFVGVGIGAAGLDVGLVDVDGALGRRWKLWTAIAVATWFLWMGVTWFTLDGTAPLFIQIAADVCFVVACAAGCLFVIASSLRFGLKRSAALDSLSTNAYSLYLVHYVPTVWLQYALLRRAADRVCESRHRVLRHGDRELAQHSVVPAHSFRFAPDLHAVASRGCGVDGCALRWRHPRAASIVVSNFVGA